ncbi:hypothetical protein PGB28_01675 [Primorskyibacter aestuariivivens]|uniref:hypothetical protein n=1 Tax=Primorskyibacter aestuariivivens TaxID=1888912 RepID=UPI002300B275|nr:hypothetical protein [Primorskyibacter aestuariivivens]MDA7427150.1 hypothetical protein [Primorskyibacter aestuariivivens]
MWLIFFLIGVIGQIDNDGGGSQPRVTEAAPPPAGGLVAEPQEPTGRFTTATEIRPILQATRGNWVAVRDFNGQDLVYFTHLLAWRCGLVQLRYAVNGGPDAVFPLPTCHEDEAAPNALKPEDGLPYVGFSQGYVQRIDVTIVYDDLAEERISVDRSGVLIP